jgi:Cys-tRNA(Pro) deacylase
MLNETATPITDLLRAKGISYRPLPHARAVFTCEEAASERGVSLSEMLKCLVFVDKSTRKAIMACVPADRRVALGKLKQIVGMKSFSIASPEQIAEMTGFQRGSIPPIGLPDSVVVIADSTLLSKTRVNISSGIPTLGLEVAMWDLRKVFQGTFSNIVE